VNPIGSQAVRLSVILGLIIASGCAGTMGVTGLTGRWMESMQTKQWVTAVATRRPPPTEVWPLVDDLIVKVGGHERVVLRPQPTDLNVTQPVVSRDGKKLAFTKEELLAGDLKNRKTWEVAEKIYIVDVDGSNLTAVGELTPPRKEFLIPGVYSSRELAWSHDNAKIVYVDEYKYMGEAGRPEQLPPRLGVGRWGESVVKQLDVVSRQSIVLLPSVRHRSTIITSQAWAPDNRRLVYINDLMHVIILDTVTRKEEDLGEGEDPTWSPDGQFIVFKKPREFGTERAERNHGDYILISVDPPRQRTVLLTNDRPFWKLLLTCNNWGYYGPALWSPDSRFLVVQHMGWLLSKGWCQVGNWHVLNRTNAEIEEYQPFMGWGFSWGGRP
jgi:Tol biopolymer transport system component